MKEVPKVTRCNLTLRLNKVNIAGSIEVDPHSNNITMDLIDSIIRNSVIETSELYLTAVNSNFDETSFYLSTLVEPKAINCTFKGADFRFAIIIDGHFTSCDFTGSLIHKATEFDNVTFENCVFDDETKEILKGRSGVILIEETLSTEF